MEKANENPEQPVQKTESEMPVEEIKEPGEVIMQVDEEKKSKKSSSGSDGSDSDSSSSSAMSELEMMEEESGPTGYTKSKNEIIDTTELEKLAPKPDKTRLNAEDTCSEFGQVIQYISESNGILLVMPSDPAILLDLDNLVSMPSYEESNLSRLVVGYISDVIGPVSMPMYTVRLYAYVLDELTDAKDPDFWKGRSVRLVGKDVKTINAKLPQMLAEKGCDASNLHDEEPEGKDVNFSDDEEEHKSKKKKPQKKSRGDDQYAAKQ
jgi:hypothetical protein